MSSVKNVQDTVLFKNVVKLIKSKYKPAQAELVSQFARYFCSAISVDEIEYKNANELYSPIVSLWNFMLESEGKVAIRAINPDFETHGWHSPHTVIEIVHPDMPFLVDSIRMELNRMDIDIHLHIHIPLDIERNKKGQITAISKPTEIKSEKALTPMYLEVDRQLDKSQLERIEANLAIILGDVRAAVYDWEPMKEKLTEIIAGFDKLPKNLSNETNKEYKSFLEWIAANHFTLLGYAYYELRKSAKGDRLSPKSSSFLGLKKLPHWKPKGYNLNDLPARARKLILNNKELLVLTKLSAISTVHRAANLDYVGVKQLNKKGEVIGEHRFVGLYTSAAYNLNPMSIPVLRHRIKEVMERSGLSPVEHASKVLRNILETYPRDELFQTNSTELLQTAMGILQMQERPLVRLFVREDPYGRFFSCLVFVPREDYTTKSRIAMMEILADAFKASSEIQFTTTFSQSILARVHFIVPVKNTENVDYDIKLIEADLAQATRSWEDNFKEALLEEYGEAEGHRLAHQYKNAFPISYQEASLVPTAIVDVKHLESLDDQNDLSMLLYRAQEDSSDFIRFKLYYRNRPKPLSEVLPMLENMGLKVVGENPFKIQPKGKPARWISDYVMLHGGKDSIDIESLKDKFQTAFREVWLGNAENDGFNRLILAAALNWRETAVLRAYAKYIWQIGSTFSQSYIEETLAAYPDIARAIVEYFNYKFDPTIKRNAAKQRAIRQKIVNGLSNVANLDQDRILNRYLEIIDATVRTNFYQQDKDGKHKSAIALKIQSSLVPDIPKPAPLYEIFVYSPRMEGVHLRGGKVARGGLRWSDRREDFRTEILGLVKAQQVKNSVIVPVGAKGGFVCKRNLQGLSRDEFMEEGIACYKIFIRSLLDVTDNLVNGQLTPPPQVVRHDDDDPYLVVAADKGTATFSDIANAISEEYGFWLGDAFASGGSVGYDHKKMGITAKGAWESVKRHFMELGVDCQNEGITVVGIGDMGGDVFGNGMLCSRHIKLVAAFNHMHIFLDPDPDPEKSYQERERLFHLPRSTWEDYNPKLISKGGGVFRRDAKSIPLSPEVKKLLGVSSDALPPNKLISAILKAKVDLLWNGGIGTYVKASTESNADVGDRANDALRINGNELRAKVVGEGGNLGLTQLGRIEYMRNGGRGNTDFIDNAGGVNCSDNEVNIKILLNQVVANGDMTVKQRNKLLAKMTDEVEQIVLRENFLQAQSISNSESRSPKMVKELMRFINWLERTGKLDRELEFLPSDEELLERVAQGEGLVRAELAVLLAYGKMVLKEELKTPEVANEPYYQKVLIGYFPTPLRKQFVDYMLSHPLKDEIIAMKLANEMVDYLGSNFAFRAIDETGALPGDVAICFSLAKEIYDMPKIWNEIEQLDHSVPADIKSLMMYQTQRMVRRCTRWFLRHRRKNLAIEDGIKFFKEGVQKLEKNIGKVLDKDERAEIEAEINSWVDAGVPRKLAFRVAYLSTMFSALDIVEMSKLTGMEVPLVAEVYYKLGAKLELHWFLDQINKQPVDNHWQAFARASFREDLDWQQRSLTVAVLHMSQNGHSAEERIEQWMNENQNLLARWNQMVADFRASGRHEFAKFSVALRELLILVQSSIRAAAISREEALSKQ